MPYGAVLPLDLVLPWQFSRRRKSPWMKRAEMAECGGKFLAQVGLTKPGTRTKIVIIGTQTGASDGHNIGKTLENP